MNRRIDITFTPADFAPEGVRYVETVIVTTVRGTFACYDRSPGTGHPTDLKFAARYVEMLLRSAEWLLRFTDHPDASLPVTGVSWECLVALREDFTIEEVGPMNPLRMARVLRSAFANGTCDIESGEFWFDPETALGSLLRTTPDTGHFDVAATLVDGMLVLNPRLTEFLTDACPAWSEVFDMAAGRLVIMDAALMTGDTIERLEALPLREAVAA